MFKYILILIITPILIYSQSSDWYKKAEKEFYNQNYEKAAELYEMALDHEIKNRDKVYNDLGYAYLFGGKYRKALSAFESSLQENENPDAYNGRGLAKGYLGQLTSAIDDFTKAIQLDQTFAQAYINRASALVSDGNFNDGLKDLTKAEKYAPENPEINFQKGRLYYRQDSLSNAAEQYTLAIEKGLENAMTHMERGNTYFKMKKFSKAIKDYNETLKLEPQNTTALNNRAISYEQLGNISQAKKDRKRLGDITGYHFKDPKDIKYVNVKSEDGTIKCKIPESWSITEEKSEENTSVVVVTPPNPKDIPAINNVRIVLSNNKKMFVRYGFKEPSGLIEFWKQSILKNNKEAKRFEIIMQKHFMFKGFTAFKLSSLIQYDQKMKPIISTDLILAKEDHLFYGYFQAGDSEYRYFENIFEEIMESLVIT